MKRLTFVLVVLALVTMNAFALVRLESPAGSYKPFVGPVNHWTPPATDDWTMVGQISTSDLSPTGLAFNGTNFLAGQWGSSLQAMIYVIDPNTGATVNQLPSPYSWPGGMAWDGTYIWVTDYRTTTPTGPKMFQLDGQTGAVLGYWTIPYSYYWAGATYDGTSIWYGVNCNPNILVPCHVYRFDLTTHTSPDSFVVPTSYIDGLTWSNNHFIYSDHIRGKLYMMTMTGVLEDSTPAPEAYPSGTCLQSNLLCVLGHNTHNIFKYNSPAPPPPQNLSGSLSGNLGPGSYNVVDSIWVAAGNTLTLAPGTIFNFAGAFGFGVAGTLTAVGTPTDSIKFIPATGVPFWKGIDIPQSSGATTVISYCYFTGANTSAIYSNFSSPTISHCFITNCSDPTYGGGIDCYQASSSTATPVVTDNLITNCTSQNGGGFHCRNCTPILRNNVFVGNNGVYGGAMAFYFSVGSITNCLFYGNSGSNAGGGVRFSSCTTTCTNCTFVGNSGGSGSAVYVINQIPILKNDIAYSNTGATTKQVYVYAGGLTVSYSCIEDSLWPGSGNITALPLFVTGPNGAYYLSQIAAGQTANSPCFDAGDPASAMITGTTRTDQVQDAGIVDMGYHYAAVTTAPALDITLTPINPPIVVPAQGGQFSFIAAVIRTVGPQASFAVWARIKNPNGSYTNPTLGPVNINPPVGTQVSRQRNQNVPASWPAGAYIYLAYANTNYSYPAIDSSSFTWTKSRTADGGPVVWDAVCSGELFPGEVAITTTPATFHLSGAYPNPFNPTTTISFTLPEAARVTLNVYDVSGRQVAQLVNGMRDAGQHQVTFDGSNLSSGVYLYTLTTGQHHASGKMALLK